jgi:hypothetical protein
MLIWPDITFMLMLHFFRKALRGLQNVAGVYGMVVATSEVQLPGQFVGHFVGSETLRAVLPRPEGKGCTKWVWSEANV